jgi:hypothetical protein
MLKMANSNSLSKELKNMLLQQINDHFKKAKP